VAADRPTRRPLRKGSRPSHAPAGEDDAPASRKPTARPPPVSSDSRKRKRGHDSGTPTLPGPYAVPRLLVAAADLAWFELDEVALRAAEMVDGRRTIQDIADRVRAKVGVLQLMVADLREKGVVAVD
jgi:hypothetical protein